MNKTLKKKSKRVSPLIAVVVIAVVVIVVVALFLQANRPSSNKRANDERRAKYLTKGGIPKGFEPPDFIKERMEDSEANRKAWEKKTGQKWVDPREDN